MKGERTYLKDYRNSPNSPPNNLEGSFQEGYEFCLPEMRRNWIVKRIEIGAAFIVGLCKIFETETQNSVSSMGLSYTLLTKMCWEREINELNDFLL